jgi:NADH:ubiquinone reductase (H+-translocating)
MTASHRILVVGGGFAGVTLVRHLHQSMGQQVQITLLSEESHATFSPMLPEVVGATLFPEHVVSPLRELTGQARFIMGTVKAIDVDARQVHAQTLLGEMSFDYDQLVLACGTRAHLNLIPGMEKHGHVLKTVGDAMFLRNLVLRRLAQIELSTDPQQRQALGHFVVIGGGFSGVETAGALIDALKSIRRYYPRVSENDLQVTLLHNTAVLLPQLPKPLGLAAARSLRQRGVDVRLEAQALEIGKSWVRLRNDERLVASTTIATIGTTTNPLMKAMDLPLHMGRVVCEADCSVRGLNRVWAIGDCALIPTGKTSGTDSATQTYAPATAQFAVAQGRYLAQALCARLNERAHGVFEYRSRGMMATTGHLKGVAQIGGFLLSGLPAWLLWRAYYLLQIPTWGRKIRIFVEWTWGMVFPPDITHFRFIKSQQAEQGIDNLRHDV